MIKFSIAAAICAISLSSGGCASLKDEQAFGKSVTDASTSLTAGLTYAQKVQLEFNITKESRLFLAKQPRRSEQNADCSTSYEREVNIAQNRISKFKIIDAYFKKIESELTNNIDFTKYTSEFDGAAATISSLPISGFSVAPELAVIKAIAGPLGRLGNQAQAKWDLKRIADIAQRIEKPLQKVVADIATGLVSSQDTLNAAVKTWETCEYERLEVIYAHENANPVEVSALFEAYQTKLASLKAQSKVVISSKGTLNAVIVANKKLADPKLTYAEAKSYAEEGSKALKDFKLIVDEIDKL